MIQPWIIAQWVWNCSFFYLLSNIIKAIIVNMAFKQSYQNVFVVFNLVFPGQVFQKLLVNGVSMVCTCDEQVK